MISQKLKKFSNRKIHISFFIGSLSIGGTEKQLLNLINSLDKNKFRIDLFILHDEKGELLNELNSYINIYLPKFKFKLKIKHFLNFIVNLYRVKKNKPDIIHCFVPFAYIIGSLIGLLVKHQNIIMSRRSLNNYQNKFKFIPIKKIESFLHKKTKVIVANSDAVKKNIIDEGVSANKTKIIYNGFIKPKEDLKESKNNFKKKLGISNNDFVFLVLANLIPYKNHKLIIRSVCSLSKIKKNFKVIFLGSGKEKYKNNLKNLIKKKKLERFFIFRDRTKYIKGFLNITDVGISSSLEEGLSNSLIEFISFGIPTISTNVGGNSEITNNENGFLIESNNQAQLTSAMKTLMFDQELLVYKSLKSKEDSKKFCLNEMIKKYSTLYQNILSENSGNDVNLKDLSSKLKLKKNINLL